MIKNSIRIFIVISAIGSIIFLPKKSFLKYLPVSLFSSVITLSEILYFTIHKLWKVKGSPSVMMCNAAVLVVGPYFLASLWVFHLSKGKFLKYFLINGIADFIFAFPLVVLFRKLNFFKLKVSSFQFFKMIFMDAIVIYTFQKFYEMVKTHQKTGNQQG
ncbi:hypothetical protein ABRT01_14380 [Lentibacillus sp. L22]|uniref:hypothetical protein n=1 Tax=Lentibacillus TaxID=175304 RepID=UPI0022B164C1|nr:hypothetical protein [Lentibacillus daqui]